MKRMCGELLRMGEVDGLQESSNQSMATAASKASNAGGDEAKVL
jgi:hypothetical protein